MRTTELYIGLMSGTSVDGIDAALVDFSQPSPILVASHYHPYPETLREQILALCQTGQNEIHRLGELDVILGNEFAESVLALLKKRSISPSEIQAIGSHGQTVRHHPHQPYRFTLQIGDPNTIAAKTGITTIADFRRKDMALGGQGAPLVPAFHQHVLASSQADRVVVNIGGIANMTLLSPDSSQTILGFDSGPGNTLLDEWIRQHKQEAYDKHGDWAQTGTVCAPLLKRLLADPYFNLSPPKSTGREHFNLTWLNQYLDETLPPADVQATLVELTAISIIQSIEHLLASGEILICGGGVHNALLMQRLRALATPRFTLDTTQKYGIDPDWMEAIAFAWLARQTLHHRPGNLPSVTGATQATVLGGIYSA